MSIEYYAALNGDRFPEPAVLNDGALKMGIPVEVGSDFADLSQHGFRQIRFGERQSGVQAGLAPLESVSGVYPVFDEETVGRYDSVVTFTFGGNPREGAVAMGLCAVLDKLADARIYSTDDDCFVDGATLTNWMNDLEAMALEREDRR